MYSLLVPAAGLGTRMPGTLPKALVPWRGRSLIESSIQALEPLAKEVVIVVRPDQALLFREHFPPGLLAKCRFVSQSDASGTSWAISLGLAACQMPLTIAVWADHIGASRFSAEQVEVLTRRAEIADIVVPIVHRRDPYAYFELDAEGVPSRFMETRKGAPSVAFGWSDCGTFALNTASVLPFLESQLAGNVEPDANFLGTFAMAARVGLKVETVDVVDPALTVGINNEEDLRRLGESL